MIFHHIGVACADIESALSFIRQTQQVINQSEIIFDKEQQAYLCMVNTASGVNIELISGEIVKNYVKKGIYVYHICWEVETIQVVMKQFVTQGALLITQPKPAVLFQYRPVAFLHSPIGLIELLGKEPT